MALTDDFAGLIEKLAANSHGVPTFTEVKKFMASKFEDTADRVQFLHPILTREPISWDNAKDQVPKWDTEKKKLDNKFHFIQGDLLETSRVEGLGSAISAAGVGRSCVFSNIGLIGRWRTLLRKPV